MKTIYTVIEDEGPVRVCVNLTKPRVDIEEEMVFVESLDFPTSVYIPDNATLASELHTMPACDVMTFWYFFLQCQIRLIFSLNHTM